jgi:hypothetical protein
MRLHPEFIGFFIIIHLGRAIDYAGFALADAFEPVVDIGRDLQENGIVFPHKKFINLFVGR